MPSPQAQAGLRMEVLYSILNANTIWKIINLFVTKT